MCNILLFSSRVKNSSVVQANQRIKINSSPSNHLVVNFTSVLPNDAGHYQCRAVKKNEKIEDGKVSSPEKPSAIEIRGEFTLYIS